MVVVARICCGLVWCFGVLLLVLVRVVVLVVGCCAFLDGGGGVLSFSALAREFWVW